MLLKTAIFDFYGCTLMSRVLLQVSRRSSSVLDDENLGVKGVSVKPRKDARLSQMIT